MKLHKILICLALFAVAIWAQRDMENLDRGLLAVKTTGGVFVSWRVLGTDAATTGFNLYRDGVKVNSALILGATNLTDASGTSSSTYTVKPVVSGVEQAVGGTATVWANQGLTINLQQPAAGSTASGSFTYVPNDIAVGDLDGDGQYELVLKWDPTDSKDNSLSGYTGNVIIDAYKLNGTRLWRIDLGVNIRAGAHYTQMLVGDYDSDGKAEVAMKTAPGTKDGSGSYLSKGPAASDDDSEDDRNSKGYVLTGNEYLTIFNGKTGKEMSTVNYTPARGTVSGWGDSYGNRVDRFLATNAYLDGKKPSMVFQRGYYTRMAVTAYDWNGTTLSQRWAYDAKTSGKECYGQGNHNLAAGDVDSDGKDEIIEGACAINDDGSFMYRTGLGHGDAMHMGDMDLDNPGMEVWEVHEETAAAYGYELHDAKTGKILWGTKTASDNGRGVAGDVDASSPGYEMWSGANYNTYSSKGVVLSTSRPSYNFRVYWDGDLQDELLDGNKLDKWNGNGSTRLITFTGNSCNSTKQTPNFSGDILGDWREEVILHNGSNQLYVYTTTIPTTYRLYTLAHDPVYRNAMSWQNAAYNQPPHLGFFLGNGVDKAPVPNIKLVGATPVVANLAPYFSSNDSFTVAENQTAVATLKGVDPEGKAVSFKLTASSDSALFLLTSAGVLTFKNAPDFENPLDAGANNIMHLSIIISDGVMSDTVKHIVTVTDVAETTGGVTNLPPVLSSNDTFTVEENTLIAGVVKAVDPEGAKVTYSLAASSDSALFQLNPLTGELLFRTSPDFENPLDNGANNIFHLEIVLNDGVVLDTIRHIVIVTDVQNEGGTIVDLVPLFVTSANLSVTEGESQVDMVLGVDPNGVEISYALQGGDDAALFTLDPSSGSLQFILAPDYEKPMDKNADNVYNIVIAITDGTFTTTQEFAITVADDPADNLLETPVDNSGTTALKNAKILRGHGVSSLHYDLLGRNSLTL